MKTIFYVALIAIAWVILFQLNMYVFSDFKHNLYNTCVFLPAGLRLVSVLLVNETAILGIFIGTFISNDLIEIPLQYSLVLSFISAINPYIAIKLSKRLLKIDDLLSNLTPSNLIMMSLISSIFNGVAQNLYLLSTNLSNKPVSDVFCMIIGDFLGCLILLYVLSISLKLVSRLNCKR